MSDMGKANGGDVPAFIDHIAPGDREKVTYIGYSQGTFQMFYGLATGEQEYYGDKIKQFIALAPCIVNNDYGGSHSNSAWFYNRQKSRGIYYSGNGPNYISQQTGLYWRQVGIEKKFQEPMPLADYVAGDRDFVELSLS